MQNMVSFNNHYQFIESLKSLPFVEQIWLFGSRARGDHHEKSDIDIAIVCPHATSENWLVVVDIVNNADTLLKIDCIQLDPLTISSDLYHRILKDRKLLYAKPTQI